MDEMKQDESLAIRPSPIISRKEECLTSLLNVHPSLSPLDFIRCGCFEEHFAFLLSINPHIVLILNLSVPFLSFCLQTCKPLLAGFGECP